MSWIEKLCQTYEKNFGAEGLVPLFHAELNTHIVVTIDEDGNFCNARLITDKSARSKIIPCTEESSSRAGAAVSPYPLFDSIQYIAGDLALYCQPYLVTLGEKDHKKKENFFRNAHKSYMEQLKGWVESSHSSSEVRAVYRYLEKETLTADLIKAEILPVNLDGSLVIEKPKTEKRDGQETLAIFSCVQGEVYKAVVLFDMYRKNQTLLQLYEDFDIRKSWANYALELADKKAKVGFCQISGMEKPLAELHPKRIRNAGDNAKLLSGNDDQNFTFRGRFETPSEASAISIDVSQKAHSALRWLIKRQGYIDDSQCIVAWAVDSDVDVPAPLKNTLELIEDEFLDKDEAAPMIGIASAAANSLNKLIAGYSAKLDTKQLCVIMLDAATPGTLAVKSYRELEGWDYLKCVKNWHLGCAWQQNYGVDKKFYGAPSPRDIARTVYGKDLQNKDPRLKSTVARLLPCILDGRPLPGDIVQSVIRRVPNQKIIQDGVWEFNKNLGIACALYRFFKSKERTYTMALEKDLKSRDYLYGRLLAVADYLEYAAMQTVEKARPTNALRLMAYFADHPYTGWRNLERALLPYKMRLMANAPGLVVNIEKLLGEIHSNFVMDEFTSDKPLSGEYLLGYYCQKSNLFTSKSKSDETNDANDDDVK